jgi:hypothetical protein
MQQGWPKLANNIFYTTANGSIAIGALLPASATINGTTIALTTAYPFGDDVVIQVTTAAASPGLTLLVRVPAWANKANVSVGGAAAQPAANGTMHPVTCPGGGATTRVVLNLNPEVRLEQGWGRLEKTSPTVPYAPGNVSLPSAGEDFDFEGGSGMAGSELPAAASDIRSGDPNEVTVARLSSLLAGEGHYLEDVSLTFRYVAGYTPAPGTTAAGSTVDLVVVDGLTGKDVATVWRSPVLDAYSYDHYTNYSPPITASGTGLHLANWQPLALELRFTNNARNLQLPLVPGVDLQLSIRWSDSKAPPPPGPPPAPQNITQRATNAVAVVRGPLVYVWPLEEQRRVVKTWQPFNNTDLDLDSSTPWAWALDLGVAPEFSFTGAGPGAQPFNGSSSPVVVKAGVRALPSWTSSRQAADEPPPSPIACTGVSAGGAAVSGAAAEPCGEVQMVNLIPYGLTNLRISAFPWIAPAPSV